MAILNITPSIHFKINPNNNLLERAIRSGLKRTVNGLKKDIGTKVKQRYTIASGAVTKTIKTRASGLTAELTSRGNVNPLERFKINPKKRLKRQPPGGVFAENVRGQGGYLRHAFIKGKGVYERTTAKRFPIKKFYGPSAPGMMNSLPMSSFILKRVAERLDVNINHELNFYLGQLFS